MSLTVKEFQRLKQDVESIRRQLDRETGAYEQIKQRLAEEFGCKTLEQAEKKLAKLEREEAELERRFEKALKTFKQEMEDHEQENGKRQEDHEDS